MNSKLIQRLKNVMSKKEISPAELSRRSGITPSSISDYLTGKYEPKQDKIDLIARALNISPAWLMGYDSEYSTRKKGTRIPVLGRVAAGIPIEAIEDVEDWEEIPESMAKKGEYFALRIKGDSMLPEIKEGDVVIVRKQSCVDSGEIAIVLVNGTDATCKKIQKQESGITLIGYNTAVYSPTFYTIKQIEDLPVRVLGKVIEIRRKL